MRRTTPAAPERPATPATEQCDRPWDRGLDTIAGVLQSALDANGTAFKGDLEDHFSVFIQIDRGTLKTWIQVLSEAAQQRERLRQRLSDLLAVIHRDGGHYEHEHGTDNAVIEALVIINSLRTEAGI